MAAEDRQDRYNYDVLKTNLENALQDLEDDTDLFVDLLCSMRKRFDALKGGATGIYFFGIYFYSGFIYLLRIY
jgi:hypothetical protein